MAKKNTHTNEGQEQEQEQEQDQDQEQQQQEAITPISLTKGSKVEVLSTEDGFGRTWFAATVVGQPHRTNKTVSVRYEHMLREGGGSLVEKVSISNLRPPPPEDPDLVLEPYDIVDAFHREIWWEGFVVKIVNEVYTVVFRDPPDLLELRRSELRAHFDWVDNSKWVRPQKEKVRTGLLFPLGTKIEIDFEGKPGTTWMPAFYLGKSEGSNYHIVKKRSKKVPDVVEVDISRIRPSPPKTKKDRFELLDKVDAFRGSLWIVGVITKVLVRKSYVVTFTHDAKEMEFDHSKLRPHFDWNNGQWVTLNTEVNQAVQSPPVDKSSNKETVISDDELAENVPLMKYKKSKGSESLFVLKSAREEVGQIENHNASSAKKRGPSRKSQFDNGQTDHAIEESQAVVKPKEVMTEKPSVETNDNGVGCEQNQQHVLCESPNENFLGNGNCISVDAFDNWKAGLVTAQVSLSNDQEISLTKNVNESGNTEAIDTPSTPFVKCSPVWKFLKATKEFTKYPQTPHFRPLIGCIEKYREGTALGHMVNFANLIDKTSKLSKDNSREEIVNCMGEFSFYEELGFDVKEVRADLNKLLETKVELEKLDQLHVEIDHYTEEVAVMNNEMNELDGKRKLLESKMVERNNKIAKLSKEARDIEKNLGFRDSD